MQLIKLRRILLYKKTELEVEAAAGATEDTAKEPEE